MTGIAEEIKKLITIPIQSFYAEIKAVDADKGLAVVDVDGLEIQDVRLRSIVDNTDKGILLIPVVGSRVLVSRIGNENELFVSMFEELEKVTFKAGSMSVLMNSGEVKIDTESSSVSVKADSIAIVKGATNWKLEGAKIESVCGTSKLTQTSAGFTLINAGVSLKTLLNSMLTNITLMTVGTAVGPSTPPVNAPAFTAIKTLLNGVLEG